MGPEIQTARRGIHEARTRAVTAPLADEMRTVGVTPHERVAQWWERDPETPRSHLVEGVMRLFWNGLGDHT
jgi:hypothetical protein